MGSSLRGLGSVNDAKMIQSSSVIAKGTLPAWLPLLMALSPVMIDAVFDKLLFAYLPVYGLIEDIYVSATACSLGGLLTVQILWRHHLQKLLQTLVVVWSTVEAQKHTGVRRLSTSRVGAAWNPLQYARGGHETSLGRDTVARHALQNKHRGLMAQQHGVHIASHTQRLALRLALHCDAVDGQQGEASSGNALRHFHSDVGQVIKPVGVGMKIVRALAHDGPKACE